MNHPVSILWIQFNILYPKDIHPFGFHVWKSAKKKTLCCPRPPFIPHTIQSFTDFSICLPFRLWTFFCKTICSFSDRIGFQGQRKRDFTFGVMQDFLFTPLLLFHLFHCSCHTRSSFPFLFPPHPVSGSETVMQDAYVLSIYSRIPHALRNIDFSF